MGALALPKARSGRSWRACLQAIDGVHGRRFTLHQVRDCAVYETLAFEHAFASEGRGYDLDREVTTAATDGGFGSGNGGFDRLPQRVDDGTLEIRRMR